MPGGWLSALLGCPESYADPLRIYHLLKERGMSFVTITDHNTIEGVLEIAHMKDVFLGCEYTVMFPEEKAKVHVLVYGFEENDHHELMKLRENIYEFVRYLKAKNIPHALAHPLYGVQDTKLNKRLVEKFVLLFDNWEVINGTRSPAIPQWEIELAERFSGWDKIYALAEKHGVEPLRNRDFIAFVAGSDDHGGMDVGRTYTEAEANSKEDFLKALLEGRTQVRTEPLGEERLINMTGKVTYTFVKRNYSLSEEVKNLLDYVFMDSNDPIMALLMRHLVKGSFQRHRLPAELIRRLPFLTLDNLLKNPSSATLGNFVLALLSQIYYLSIIYLQRKEERRALDVIKGFGVPVTREVKLAYVTDTYEEINGVARTAALVRQIAQEENIPLDVITVGDNHRKDPKLVTLQEFYRFSLPYYRDFPIRVPAPVDVFRKLKDYTHLHVATPGPLGVLALVAAKVLGMRTSFAFHTDIPAYARIYTGDPQLEEFLWSLMVYMCNACDRIFVPSKYYRDLLVSKGVEEAKIRIFERGVDTELFSPYKRQENFWQKLGIKVHGKVILYVGRVSKEKNLDTFVEVAKTFPQHTFVVVGDGPYRQQLEENKPQNLHLVGYLVGEDLATAYASADIFLFPSETETYGQVVLEAMASGLPVVVSGRGGAGERVTDGLNGFVAFSFQDYIQKLEMLLKDHQLRERIGNRAYQHALSMNLRETYLKYIDNLLGVYVRS